MYDNLAAYFHENVLTSYKEFIDSLKDGKIGLSKDLRAAINAATVLYHLREHLPQPHQKSRQQVASACPDYDLVADIANASKHGELTRRNRQISKAEDIQEELVLTKYKDEDGEFFSLERTVVAQLSDGSFRQVGEILTNVINYWCNEFYSLGIISNPVTFTYDTTVNHMNRQQVEEQKNELEAIRGVRFKQGIKLQEYNYETGEATPLDLTGSELRMLIYKPKHYTLVINLENEQSGEVITKEIELSEEQYSQYKALETENNRQEYLAEIVNQQGIAQELAREARAIEEHNNHINSDW